MLALTFVNKDDYDKVREDDTLSVVGLESLTPRKNLTITVSHKDGSKDAFEAQQTYNRQQIKWFKAGSALNVKH